MARSARRAGRQPSARPGRRARAALAAVLVSAGTLLASFLMAGVAGAAGTTNPIPIASASAWAPLVTIAIVTAVLGGIMFWRTRRARRDRGS